MTQFGEPTQFGFDLSWSEEAGTTAADATRGQLRVWLASRSIWGGPGGLEWTWVELLEHIARFWPCLILEEMDPLGLGDPAEDLRRRAEKRWATTSDAQRCDEEEALFAYLEAHDLAAGLGGVFPAPVFISREGSMARIAARGAVTRVSFDDAERTLVQLGNAIAARLRGLGDERARTALEAWDTREDMKGMSAAATATGLREAEVVQLFSRVAPDLITASLAALRAPNELLAVARMTAGTLPIADAERILAEVGRQPHVWTQPIDELTARVARDLSELRELRPWDQGYVIAHRLRAQRQHAATERFDPESLLAEWRIPVTDVEIDSRLLDALCVWGPKHGPAILVNRRGRRGRMNGRRATLAHEIGHLLMDRHAGLPVGEVLGGRVSQELESRANAFAAELLIPREEAYRRVISAQSIDDEVGKLSAEYGASREIIAWQARNGATSPLDPHIRATLSAFVSNPRSF